MNICIVSPHIDDAILSCGIRIQREIGDGHRVFILDIFSAGTNGDNRQKEELRAARIIGAEAHFLNELDAPDRDPRYTSIKELFLGDLLHTPPAYIEKLAERLREFFAAHKIARAYFPLAAGTHIDHRVAYEAGRKITTTQVRYYEDRPYILWPGILQGRMNQIGSDADLSAVSAEDMERTIDRYHYVSHFVPPGKHREETMPLYQASLQPPPAIKLRAKPETLRPSDPELKKMFDALKAYESQMPYIYPDFETFIRDSLTYERSAGHDGYTERSWDLQPA